VGRIRLLRGPSGWRWLLSGYRAGFGLIEEAAPSVLNVHSTEVVLSGAVSIVDSSTTPSWGFATRIPGPASRVGHRTTCPILAAPSLAHGGRGVIVFCDFFLCSREQNPSEHPPRDEGRTTSKLPSTWTMPHDKGQCLGNFRRHPLHVVAQRLSIHREAGHCGRDQVGSKEKRKGSNP
jgi:hypothetical protein